METQCRAPSEFGYLSQLSELKILQLDFRKLAPASM